MAKLVANGSAIASPASGLDADELEKRDVTATLVMAPPDAALLARLGERA